MSDVLKKPVHKTLHNSTPIDDLAKDGKITSTPFGVNPAPEKQPLPKEEKPRPVSSVPKFNTPKLGIVNRVQENTVLRTKLRVLHESIPPLAKDKKPPCASCKTAACCRAFVVSLSQKEYESGLYGDQAIKITPEIAKQLQGSAVALMMLTAPSVRLVKDTQYFLEGKVGDPCPFLGEDNSCTIYNDRPIVCRTYTCVDDPRITQEMRDGTE
jgi:Fe-S-cluster containining protein